MISVTPGWAAKSGATRGAASTVISARGKSRLSPASTGRLMTASPTQLGARTRTRRTTSGSRVNRRDT